MKRPCWYTCPKCRREVYCDQYGHEHVNLGGLLTVTHDCYHVSIKPKMIEEKE